MCPGLSFKDLKTNQKVAWTRREYELKLFRKILRSQTIIWIILFLLTLGSCFNFISQYQRIIILEERCQDLETKGKTISIHVERYYDNDAKTWGYKTLGWEKEK